MLKQSMETIRNCAAKIIDGMDKLLVHEHGREQSGEHTPILTQDRAV